MPWHPIAVLVVRVQFRRRLRTYPPRPETARASAHVVAGSGMAPLLPVISWMLMRFRSAVEPACVLSVNVSTPELSGCARRVMRLPGMRVYVEPPSAVPAMN